MRNEEFKRKLLLEYGKIMVNGVREDELPDVDQRRLVQLRGLLHMNHEKVMRELQEYLRSTVSK
jgi:hypothetical protein